MSDENIVNQDETPSTTRRTAIKSIASVVGTGVGTLLFSDRASAVAHWKITHKASGRVLEVANWGTDNGDNVQLWDWHGGDNQIWVVAGGSEVFTNNHSGKVMEIPGGNTELFTQVQQWEYHGGSNQEWIMNEISSGSHEYEIRNKYSDRLLTGDYPGGGNRVYQYYNGGTPAPNQIWVIDWV